MRYPGHRGKHARVPGCEENNITGIILYTLTSFVTRRHHMFSSRTIVPRAVIATMLFIIMFTGLGREAFAELPYQTVWTRQMGTGGEDKAFSVDVDLSGNIYVAGFTYGGLDGNVNAGGYDLFVVKYDSAGVKQWTRLMGTAADDHAYGASVDGFGNVYVTGFTYGGLDGNVNAGGYDLFVVKYDSAGVKQWTRQMGTAVEDSARGVSVDDLGNVYVSGYTYGGLDGNASAGGYDLFVV
ncbi:MAG: SBBP repeat-containing protein, partial [Nitrospirae bacterium]|nr:SBBP repeat-containing protein [Nitrospirota bacterium]